MRFVILFLIQKSHYYYYLNYVNGRILKISPSMMNFVKFSLLCIIIVVVVVVVFVVIGNNYNTSERSMEQHSKGILPFLNSYEKFKDLYIECRWREPSLIIIIGRERK